MEVFARPSHAFGQLDPTPSAMDTEMDIDMDIDLGPIDMDEPTQNVVRLDPVYLLGCLADIPAVRTPNFG